jgi:hypothetical protein
MAFDARGLEYDNIIGGRVKYCLLTDEQAIESFSSGDIPPEDYLFTDDEIILD